jgi:hypothetical protein
MDEIEHARKVAEALKKMKANLPPEVLRAVDGLELATAESVALMHAREEAEAEANYRLILECSAAALAYGRYTREDREIVETNISGMTADRADMRMRERHGDFNSLATYDKGLIRGFLLGGRLLLSDSEKNYRESEKQSELGKKQP